MRRGIIAALLTAVLLTALPFCGSAADTSAMPYGWRQNTFSDIDLSEGYFTFTDSDAYDGRTALKLNNRSFTNNDNKSVFLRNDLADGAAAGRYVFSFYMKTDAAPYIIAEFDGTGKKINFEGWNANFAAAGYTKTAAENGWTRAEAVFETSAPMTGFYFQLFGFADGILIDKVSLTRDGGENLIKNGSFELADAAADELYTPKNIITNVNRQKRLVGISWINPKSITLCGVSLKNTADGTAAVQKLRSGCGEISCAELEIPDGQERYLVKLCFEFSDGESRAFYVSGSMTDSGTPCGAWITAKNTGGLDTLPADAAFDTEYRVSGENSLKIISNIDGEKPSHYMDLRAPIQLTPGKTYKIRAYVRAENVKKLSLAVDWSRVTEFRNASFAWKLVEAEYKNTSLGDTFIRIIVDDAAEGFWIDKIEVYETKNGKITGSNLFEHGEFEDYAADKPGSVAATVRALDGGAELSWLKTAAEYSIERIFVRMSDGENDALIAKLYKGDSELTVDGLENGREYTFTVYTENAAGKRSELCTAVCTPRAKKEPQPYGNGADGDDLIFTNRNFQRLDGGLTVENPYMTRTESGKIASAVYVRNCGSEPRGLCVMSIVYRNGILFDVTQLRRVIEPSARSMPGEEIRIISDIPEDAENEYTVKTVIWDSAADMKPLDAAAELQRTENAAATPTAAATANTSKPANTSTTAETSTTAKSVKTAETPETPETANGGNYEQN